MSSCVKIYMLYCSGYHVILVDYMACSDYIEA